MAEKDDIMSTIRDEALPLGEALKKFGDGAFQVALTMMAQGIWSPENFTNVTCDAIKATAPKIDAEFNKLKEG